MEKESTVTLVVAAAMLDHEGRLLLQQRPAGKRHGGMWEFPGGKVEANENPRFSLVREIEEELSVRLDAEHFTPAGFAEEPAAEGYPAIVMLLYTASVWHGDIEPLEAQRWSWFAPAQASALDLPPMDRALLERFL